MSKKSNPKLEYANGKSSKSKKFTKPHTNRKTQTHNAVLDTQKW